MSAIEALALRCLLPGFDGTEPPDWVLRRVDQGLGAVLLFGRNIDSPEQVRRLTDSLHAVRPDLVIAIDEEGGDVTRLEARTGSSYPGNLALGAAGDVWLTRDVAAAMGAELRAAGVDLNLAPVVDVNTNPVNPIIGVRSFGADPAAVARHGAAWIEGMQGAGVAACAKHFPGHGDTAVDSHLELPVAGEDPRLRALEPFRAAIGVGVRAIMSAHIVSHALDELPATISPRIMTGLLRDELGFRGLAISDGLDMAGLSGRTGIAEAAVAALAAGCDLLCIGGGPSDETVVTDIVNAVVKAVVSGRLPEERLSQAATRIKDLSSPLAGKSGGRDGAVLQASRGAVCWEGDVRVGAEAQIVHLESPGSIASGEIPWGLAHALEARGVAIGERGRIVIEVRDLHRRHRGEVEELLRRHPDAILVEMGLPACRPTGALNYVATRGSARVLAEAAAELMTVRS